MPSQMADGVTADCCINTNFDFSVKQYCRRENSKWVIVLRLQGCHKLISYFHFKDLRDLNLLNVNPILVGA